MKDLEQTFKSYIEEITMENVNDYYKSRAVRENQNFYERNRTAIWFYTISTSVIGLGIIPWVVGWYTIIF